jgi:glycosyltransferase involved in cell wall biosynthesis
MFHLARELHKRASLERIVTTYPRFKLRQEDLPDDKILCDWLLETLCLGMRSYGLHLETIISMLTLLKIDHHDRFLASHIPPCDIFIALSGSGAKVGPAVQANGSKYICDRGSPHIVYADEILEDEYRRYGIEHRPIHPRHVERELREYEAADAIVLPSTFAADSFIQKGVDSRKVRLNPYGASLSRFRREGEPDAAFFTVLYVGSVKFAKGIPYLLEAFRHFRHPGKRLVIVGAVMPEIKSYLAKATLDSVAFVGPVPNATLASYMSRADVLVLPSLMEGLALVQAEALACGCPVIATTNTGGSDLFEDEVEGFIVPIRDPAAITAKLERLADDPVGRLTMRAAAQNRMRGLGGWSAYGDRYEAICRDVLAGA